MTEQTRWKVYPSQADFKAEEIREAGSHAKIAKMAPGWPKSDTDTHARLMAAAPDLLDALRVILLTLRGHHAYTGPDSNCVGCQNMELAQAAIKAAGGNTE